jgi:hypothetical protein
MITAKKMGWAWHVTRTEKRNAYRILVGKGEEKRREETPLGKPGRKWEDNIKKNLREIGWGGIDWIHLTQDRASGGLL